MEAPLNRRKITRREALTLGIVGAAGLVVPVNHVLGIDGNPTAPFQIPLRIPPVLQPTRVDATTDYYEVDIKPARVEILPGKQTTIWGYNGLFPGPTLKTRSGRNVVVRQVNNLAVETNVHLHGGFVAPEHDGGPNEGIAPGSYRDYVYPNRQIASTLWYHDHVMHQTARNVYMGLGGFYIIEDDLEKQLNLPRGEYDVPLMIQDRLFNADGSFSFPAHNHDGVNGDTILVNGTPQPVFKVARRKYRFRILNASNSRHYELALNVGSDWRRQRLPFLSARPPLIQIGSDGGLLQVPVARSTIPIGVAERVEIIVDFAQFPIGSQIILENKLGRGKTAEIMRFDVAQVVSEDSSLPSTLRTVPALSGASITRDIELSMNLERGEWVINGKSFDPQRVDAQPKLGSTEVWRIINRSNVAHPFHMHLVMFQILDRNGVRPSAGETGWKDTVTVGPSETVRIIAKFDGYTGKYMFHCHNLQHEDHMMMAQFEVVP